MTENGVWKPYNDVALLTPPMVFGFDKAEAHDQERLLAYLSALVATRTAPVHVNVAFNAAFFGFDLAERSYVGGPVDPFAFPVVPPTEVIDALPVGAMVRVDAGAEQVYAEVVYKEGAHPTLGDDGEVDPWLSGAPLGAVGPGRVDDEADPLLSERLVVDIDAFGSAFSLSSQKLDRLRRLGRGFREDGHLVRQARYPTRADADLDDMSFYARYLLTRVEPQIMSSAAPLPMEDVLEGNADSAQWEGAIHGFLRTIRTALEQLDDVRMWRGYAFTRASMCARLNDSGVLGGGDMTDIASQLARSPIPSSPRRFSAERSVSYTAVGPQLRGVKGAERRLAGLDYALAVCHVNSVLSDYTHREVDQETKLLAGDVHLRLDDEWQGGGVWRAERPGSAFVRVDVTEPLGRGWLDTLPGSPEAVVPQEESVLEWLSEPTDVAEDDTMSPVDLKITDSQLSWSQPLRLVHLLEGRLPLPDRIADAMAASRLAGVGLRLLSKHDGYQLDQREAAQNVQAELHGPRREITSIDWPLEFFPGMVLTCSWTKDGTLVRVCSTLLEVPVSVDGQTIEHRYAAWILARDAAPGEPRWGKRDSRSAGVLTLPQRVLRAVRRNGKVHSDGRTVLVRSQLSRSVYGADGAVEVSLDDVVTKLVASHDLREDIASVDANGGLRFPAVAGFSTVPVLVYKPLIVPRGGGPGREPALPHLDSRFVREHPVTGHLRRIGHLGKQPTEKARELYRADCALRGVAEAELPADSTFVSDFRRRPRRALETTNHFTTED
ncbi:hypothetical protein [Allokutzneria oryzae]|uniref:DUF2357 domain-containing protein n=1 Tax=Allokutzneria oryzae TaxID=1378989 RepID=A0ABV5ZXB2_9PSEU